MEEIECSECYTNGLCWTHTTKEVEEHVGALIEQGLETADAELVRAGLGGPGKYEERLVLLNKIVRQEVVRFASKVYEVKQ